MAPKIRAAIGARTLTVMSEYWTLSAEYLNPTLWIKPIRKYRTAATISQGQKNLKYELPLTVVEERLFICDSFFSI